MPGRDGFLPFAFVRSNKRLLRFWSDLETFLLGKKIECPIQNPIFVCGLARSGTTLITHILSAHRQTGSFLYRDLPFIEIPYLWHFVGRWYYGNQPPRKREHGDEILIDPNAPDAFEELIWKNYIEDYARSGFCTVLSEDYANPELEQQLRTAICKVLYVRGRKTRYLSKGNYNVFRLSYILRLFPDAKIVLCVRNPFDHARSLARVHAQFLELAMEDKYFTRRLEILGHYEFGPQRKVIRLNDVNAERALKHWEGGEHYEGYLLQWKDVYTFAHDSYAHSPNILWFDSMRFAKDRAAGVRALLEFCELPPEEIEMASVLHLIKEPTSYPLKSTPYDEEMRATYQLIQSELA
jgi:hypothetical protein